jgi:xylulokinase
VDDGLFLGLDVGTSGVKALLVRPGGDVAAAATTPLAMDTPRPGWAEQDPGAWWAASVASVRAVLARAPGARVAAVGVSGQMHSSVFLDRAGEVIRPALLWCDGRTTAECAQITERAGGEGRLREWVRNPALEGFTLPKVLWLRDHEPAAYARLATVLLGKDFVRYRLTGALATEPSDASGTLMFDPGPRPVERRAARRRRRAGVAAPRRGRVGGGARPGDRGGRGRDRARRGDARGGRRRRQRVRRGGRGRGGPGRGGGQLGDVGHGARAHRRSRSSTRGSGRTRSATARARRVVRDGRSALGRRRVRVVPRPSSPATRWALPGGPDADARLDAEAAGAPPGADGVTFLPYLQGEARPTATRRCAARIVALARPHARPPHARRVLEGVCFAMRDSSEILRGLRASRPAGSCCSPGRPRSPFLRPPPGRRVRPCRCARPTAEEGPAYGAALLAAVGAGAFPDLAAAARATLVRSPGEAPDPAAHAAYAAAYARFRSLGAAAPAGVRRAAARP